MNKPGIIYKKMKIMAHFFAAFSIEDTKQLQEKFNNENSYLEYFYSKKQSNK